MGTVAFLLRAFLSVRSSAAERCANENARSCSPPFFCLVAILCIYR